MHKMQPTKRRHIKPNRSSAFLPDDLRADAFNELPNGPSGIKNATNRAHTTKNEPKTNGGPGSDCIGWKFIDIYIFLKSSS